MPAAYAHMVFGMEVTAILPISAQESINRHPELFGIGLQGPDILFYYHPSETQAYVLYGHNIHKRPAADFFRYALVQLEKLAELEKAEREENSAGANFYAALDEAARLLNTTTEKSGGGDDEI